jgi:DtxR family transcriptional regulator, Mn-dependent transcriptional regulator
MKLTEELVELLQRINTQAELTTVSDEAFEDAEQEGLIVCNGQRDCQLTPLGDATLADIQRRLISVNQLRLHEHAKIAYVSQRNYARFQTLCSFGLSSGVPVSVRQKFPSFVIQCEETQIALEEEIARDIFVWRG